MRISDWSSDVCSSDLGAPARSRKRAHPVALPAKNLRCTAPDPVAHMRGSTTNRVPLVLRSPGQASKHTWSARHPARSEAMASENSIQRRSEEHTSELQSLMRISYAVFCLQKK